jgi:hypothetical protein
MADPINGIGSLQNLISGTRVSEPQQRRVTDTKNSTEAKDDVSFTPQNLNSKQAEEVTTKLRSLLESDQSLSLGKGSGFDESL